MPVVLLTRESLPRYRERIARITADTPRQWGTMDARRMMAHLTRSIELSLGEQKAPDNSTLLSRTLLRWLFFHVLTNWPKGKIKAPEYFSPEPEGDFAAEQARLLEALERFVAAAEAQPQRREVSELLGPTTLATWRRVHGVHMDHHLRQFGA